MKRRFELLQDLMLERDSVARETIRRAMIRVDNELITRRGFAWGPSDYQVTDSTMLAFAQRMWSPHAR